MDSVGDVLGDFVVTGVTETRRDIGPAGPPLRLAHQVALRSVEVNRQEPQALDAALLQFDVQAG